MVLVDVLEKYYIIFIMITRTVIRSMSILTKGKRDCQATDICMASMHQVYHMKC